jgi:hypothetical protein
VPGAAEVTAGGTRLLGSAKAACPTYRQTWTFATGTVIAVGLGTMVVVVTADEPLFSLSVLALVLLGRHVYRLRATVAAGKKPTASTADGPPGLPSELRTLVRLVMTLATVVGMAVLVGFPGVVLVVADLLAGLPLMRAERATVRPYGPSDRSPRPAEAKAAMVAHRLAHMSVAELCQAWQASSHALACTSAADERAHIVGARALFLDAMTARDPRGVAAWLACNGPERSGPERFLRDDGGNS